MSEKKSENATVRQRREQSVVTDRILGVITRVVCALCTSLFLCEVRSSRFQNRSKQEQCKFKFS